MTTKYRSEIFIFLFTVAVRLAVLLVIVSWSNHAGDFDGHPQSKFPIFATDSYEYFTLAKSMINPTDFTDDQLIALLKQFRTPGYPIFGSNISCFQSTFCFNHSNYFSWYPWRYYL